MGRFSELKIDWHPFEVCPPGVKAPYPRGLTTKEGLGDRLRFVAFAEKQATEAFGNAELVFPEAPMEVKQLWRDLAREEKKHLNWLLARMSELGVSITERPQSLALWVSFDRCTTVKQFADFMANAEERGRVAGEQFYETLLKVDPTTAELFQKIALEEQDHINLAREVVERASL